MGMDWYLVDKHNKTFYELGRGNWYIIKDDFEALSDKEYLEHFLLTDVCGSDDRDDEWNKYVSQRVVDDLFTNFGSTPKDSLKIINDSTDDLWIIRCKGYTCIGTRFEDKNTKEYQDYLDNHLNRHLCGRSAPHLYSPQSAQGYPGWSDW